MVPDDLPQPDTPLNEFSAAAAISALSKPPAAPKGPDGRFQSPNPPREPENPDPEPIDEPDAAATDDGALGEDDIEIDAGDEAELTQAPSLDMPDSWGKTAADLWQGLSPEQQQFIKQHESKRTSGLSRQANELKAAQDQVKAEAARVEQERLQLAQAAQRYQSDAVKRFQAEFGDVKDIQSAEKLAAENPARYLKWQAAHMAALSAVQEASQWSQAIEQDRIKQLTEFRQAENAKLAERFGLDDEAKATAFQDRIVKFVEPLGITPQRLAQYTAEEIALADDGRKWRAAMAKRQQVERQKAPPPKVIRPGTPQTGSNLREQSVTQLSQQLRKTGSDRDAAALIKVKFAPPGSRR